MLVRRRRSAQGGTPNPGGESAAAAEPDGGLSGAERWALAALGIGALAYLGLTLVALTPLPGSVDAVFYPTDVMFHIAVTGEALHHWPPQAPLVSDGALHYHYFFHLQAAAAAQVTGIGVPVLVTRLCIPPLVLLLTLQLGLAGRAVTGLRWAGPVAAGLGLAAWELDLSVPEISPFLGVNDIWLWASPSYLLGLVFLVPLSALAAGVAERRVLARIAGSSALRGVLAVIAVLAFGAAGSKVVAVPVVAGGLGLFLLWSHLRGRPPLDRASAGVLAICVAAFAAVAAFLYMGGGGSELRLDPGGVYERMPSLRLLELEVPDSFAAEAVFWVAGLALTTLLHFGPVLLGLYWIVGRGRPPLRPGQALLLCMLLVGLPAWFLLASDNADNAYFTAFGIAAALPVIAEGLVRGLGPLFAGREASARRPALLAAGWAALLLGAAWIAWEVTLDGHPARAYVIAYGALGLGLLAALAWARGSARRAGTAIVLSAAVLTAAALDPLLDSVPTTVRKLIDGEALYAQASSGGNLTPEMVEAAGWIREETDEGALLAVSNQSLPVNARYAPLRAEIPALAERRSFHEGWAYSRGELRFGDVVAGDAVPYPERVRLEREAFERGDPRALRALRDRFGVTHLVIDRTDGRVPRRVYEFGALVFSNGEVDVIELD